MRSDILHSDVEKLNVLLDWYDDFIEDIKKYQIDHKDWFNSKYRWFYFIWEKSISLLSKTLWLLNYVDKKNWKSYYWTQCVFMTNAIPFIYSTYYNILNWHYQIASTLNRTSFETLLRIYFINFNSDCYGGVFGELNRKDLINKWIKVPKFNITNFINEKLNWKFLDIYSVLSHESHSSIISVWKDLEKIKEWTYEISINMQWDIDFSYNMNVLIMIIYALLKYIDEIFLKNINLEEIEKQIEFKRILENKDYLLTFLNNYLFTLPNKRKLNEEINEIMKQIIELEFKN